MKPARPALLCLLVAHEVRAAAPTLHAVRTAEPPAIDGKLDDPAWQQALVETHFTQHFPDPASPASEPTELRVLYDDRALYIGLRCFDRDPEHIVARLTRRDRDNESDRVQIDISSKNDRASAYHFEVNAANVQIDGVRSNDTDYSSDPDTLWYSETSRDGRGWTAEIEIPLVALRYSGDTTSFGFQVRRVVQRLGETDEWAAVPRDAQGEVSHYGTLDGLTGLGAPRLLQITPFSSVRVALRRQQGSLDGTAAAGTVGADLKLGLTPALTLDGTFNPDFGNVEVDQVVLNLTHSETLFPEKRPFFLEGSELFHTSFAAFYSRRIGRDPPDPQAGTAVDVPPQGRIWGAVKTTGVLTGRLSIAAIDAVTARQDVEVDRGSGHDKVLVEPLTNFAVLRLRDEFADNDSVSVIATAVNRFEPARAAAPVPGDLCPIPYDNVSPSLPGADGRCTSDAYVIGADTVLRTADGAWDATAQVIGSLLEHGPARALPDGSVVQPGTPGYGVTAQLGKHGGEPWLVEVGIAEASPQLDLNDAGFQPASGYRNFYGGVQWRRLEPMGPLLEMSYTLNVADTESWDFRTRQQSGPSLAGHWQLKNFWTIDAEVRPWLSRGSSFRETFSDAIATYPASYGYFVEVRSDPRRAALFDLTGNLDGTTRGQTAQAAATIGLRMVPKLELDLISAVVTSSGQPRTIDEVDNADASRTFYFADLDYHDVSATLRGTYTVTPRLSLMAYAQVFLASGHFGRTGSATVTGARPNIDVEHLMPATAPVDRDFRDGNLNVNLFLRWELRPGSTLWLVYTRAQAQPPSVGGRFSGPTTDVMLAKLSYMWEPLLRSRR